MAFAPQRVGQEWTVDAPVSVVWEVLGQTDRLNRESGLPSVQLSSFEDEEIGRRVEARLYNILRMSWIEYPFEWERNRNYVVQRDYSTGPITRFRGGVEVEPQPGGSLVRMFAELTPRNVLGRLAIPFVAHDTIRKAQTYCSKALALLQPASALPERRFSNTEVDGDLLARRVARLGQIPSLDVNIVAALIRHVTEAGDDEVVRMQPYALALRWGTDRHETLRVFLHATRAGVMSLVWELMCPNCRVPKAEANSLADVSQQFHCDACGIAYNANFDRYVELRFRVHPGIRPAQNLIYCFGGPYSAPHILAQHLLRPGESRDLTLTLGQETYRIRTLRQNLSTLLVPATIHPLQLTHCNESNGFPAGRTPPADLSVTCGDGGWEREDQPFVSGPVRLRWTNRSARLIGVVLERLRWDELAVSAARVATLQEFRDLFGSEVLTPGQEIGVESVTILFTDLKESTRLYEESGDAPAYGHVRRHFDFIKERVARRQGAVVKTIGDAVMAAFYQPADAVRCCLDIQRDLPAFNANAALAGQKPLVVKLGVHHGPAIAINANGRLDYFGRTVNIASRLLRESAGGDLVLAKEVVEEPAVGQVLGEEKAAITAEWTPLLRGLPEPLTLCRIGLS